MSTEYVLVESALKPAHSILKSVSVATGKSYVVLPRGDWIKIATERATMIMSDRQREIWNSLHYAGPTEKGVWLAGADMDAVATTGGAPVCRNRYVHISVVAYLQLRDKYFVWWEGARWCNGWSHQAPDPSEFLPANEPTPVEMNAYKALVNKYFSPDGGDDTFAEIERRSIRCDRNLKIFNLAKAKAAK
jgi:hypothetical protein